MNGLRAPITSAVILASLLPQAGHAQCSDRMPTIYADMAAFGEDANFDLQIRPSVDGTVVRVTGDTVIVDEQRLSSLVSPASAPKTKIASLTFDARVLIIRGPISLESAKLSLLADEIRFERGGSITLVPASAKEHRELRIVADTVDFKKGGRRPIDLSLIDSADVNSFVVARSFGGVAEVSNAWTYFVDSIDMTHPPSTVKFELGGEAVKSLGLAWHDEMQWPLFFAAKVRKHFNRAPFDEVNRNEVLSLLSRYRTRMLAWREPQPYSVLSSIGAAIEDETDLSGHRYSYTPKQDLGAQLKDLREQARGPSFDYLSEILASTVKNDKEVADALALTRTEIKQVDQEAIRLEREIDNTNRTLQVLAQDASSISDRLDQRSKYLQVLQEREYKRMRDAQKVKQWTTVAASAVVIAASMGAATPAVAAGVGAGLAVTGDAIYANNTGQPVTIGRLVEQGAASYTAARSFADAWNTAKVAASNAFATYGGEVILDGPPPPKGQEDKRKPLGKGEATGRLVTSLAAAKKAADAINGGKVAAPTPLSLSSRENEDEVVKELLVAAANNRQAISVSAATLADQVQKLETLSGRRAELQLVDVALRTARPANDQEAARWNGHASILWAMRVQKIASQVSNIEKSLFFETGSTVLGDLNVLDYPNELQSQAALGVLDPYGGTGGAGGEDDTKKRLLIEKTKFLTSIETVLDAVDTAYTSYLNSRTDADVYRKSVTFSAYSDNPIHRKFVDALNGQIRQQIVGKSGIKELLPAYIPFSFSTTANPYPERLVRARVLDVSFNVPRERVGNNALEFTLVHPGYGEMRRGQKCYPADLRSSPGDWRFFNSPLESLSDTWITQEPSEIKIDKGKADAFYTRYPARSPYAALVNVTSSNWYKIPEIEEITIGFEVMQ